MEFIYGFMFVQILANPWLGLGVLTTSGSYRSAFIVTIISMLFGFIGFIGLGL